MLEVVNERKNLKYPRHWYSHVLGSPESHSLTEQAKRDIRESRLSDSELLSKYYWLDQGYIGTGLTLEQLREIRNHKENSEEITATTNELKSELNLTSDEWRNFEVSRDIIFMKSLRADSRQYLHVVTNLIAENFGKFWNIEPKLVSVMNAEEISEIVNENKRAPGNLSERFNHSILVPEKTGKYTVVVGQDVSSFLGKTLQRENIAESDIIKGQTAYQGLVRGRVKLVFGPQHNEKIKEEDILVSTATSPQLLPAMIRAAAFVTDVGGVTSHAAIVARELRKPCVVGTKYATQLLTDGQEIEVDADNAVIRILK